MMANLTLKLTVPSVPNYIVVEGPFVPATPMTERPKVDIADLSDEQLRALAEEWKGELLRRAEVRRQERKTATILTRVAKEAR